MTGLRQSRRPGPEYRRCSQGTGASRKLSLHSALGLGHQLATAGTVCIPAGQKASLSNKGGLQGSLLEESKCL